MIWSLIRQRAAECSLPAWESANSKYLAGGSGEESIPVRIRLFEIVLNEIQKLIANAAADVNSVAKLHIGLARRAVSRPIWQVSPPSIGISSRCKLYPGGHHRARNGLIRPIRSKSCTDVCIDAQIAEYINNLAGVDRIFTLYGGHSTERRA